MSNSFAHIPEVQALTPRGKFDLYFMKNFMPTVHYNSFFNQIIRTITKQKGLECLTKPTTAQH